MKIEEEFLQKLMQPLEDQSVPTIKEYFEQLAREGITIQDNQGRIDAKLEIHLNQLINRGLISNQNGQSSLKDIGISLGANKHISIVGNIRVMKPESNNQSLPINNFNISSINASNVQVGNENVQNITINELVERISKSDDPEAKSTLKKLLENSTVGSVIGAGISGLIGIL